MLEQLALIPLVNQIQKQPASKVLLVVDESCPFTTSVLEPFKQNISILTNRFDVFELFSQKYFACMFNDFDFKETSQPFDMCVFRISKERPVTHHVLNNCTRILKENGKLVIAGRKNEGIKSYADAAIKQLNFQGKLNKKKELYIGEYTKIDTYNSLLETKDYTKIRHELTIEGKEFYTKPGMFGWQKEDTGSKLLLKVLADKDLTHVSTALDLGSGYGYLGINYALAKNHTLSNLEFTDNNAAAILACEKNCENLLYNIAYHVTPSDAGNTIQNKFDLILCNPPFHIGFDTSSEITERFVKSAHRLLEKKGTAFFVTNSFIGIEKVAEKYFSTVELCEKTPQFKVLKFA